METLYADRSSRAKLCFLGPQAAWFLHQVTTQAFEDIAPDEARDAAMITPHGRMVGYLEAVRHEDAIYCHLEEALRHEFPPVIGRYILGTQVEIQDVTDEWGLVLLAGQGWQALAEHAPASAFVHATSSLGVEAAYLWVAHSEVEGLKLALAQAGAREATEAELEALRIDAGVPRWGHEMTDKTIPLEVGLERTAIHFDKGCYVGQEAIAKIHLRGRPNKRLARVTLDKDVGAPAELREGDAVAGVLTSVSGTKGIAVVKRTVEPGAVLVADGAHVSVVD